MADTTTVLNPGVGGDTMDETLVTQSDGVTAAKRPRVDVGYEGKLVGESSPLPVSNNELLVVMQEMLEELREIKLLLISLGS